MVCIFDMGYFNLSVYICIYLRLLVICSFIISDEIKTKQCKTITAVKSSIINSFNLSLCFLSMIHADHGPFYHTVDSNKKETP